MMPSRLTGFIQRVMSAWIIKLRLISPPKVVPSHEGALVSWFGIRGSSNLISMLRPQNREYPQKHNVSFAEPKASRCRHGDVEIRGRANRPEAWDRLAASIDLSSVLWSASNSTRRSPSLMQPKKKNLLSGVRFRKQIWPTCSKALTTCILRKTQTLTRWLAPSRSTPAHVQFA